jgi:ornithine carbamoyltransferase
MADVMTFEEHLGPIAGRKIAWSGDGNNMATSWIHAAVQFGFELRLACPEALMPPADVLRWAERSGGRVSVSHDVERAVQGADCVVTDAWVSMGDTQVADRHNLLAPFRVDERLMGLAKPQAIFLHCLPAHRGEEVTPNATRMRSVAKQRGSILLDQATGHEIVLQTEKVLNRWAAAADHAEPSNPLTLTTISRYLRHLTTQFSCRLK